MTLLTYKLHQLGDASERAALFHDLVTAREALSATDLPAFLDEVDKLLTEAWLYKQDKEAQLQDARDRAHKLADLVADVAFYDLDDFYNQAAHCVAELQKDLADAPD